MKVLIDEDTAVQLLGPLAHVLPRHQVDHITRIRWAGKKDRSVLADARGAGYDAIITKDRNQLSDPGECDAIKRSGLHHVRYRQRQDGAYGLALALGAIISAMPKVMEELEASSGQRLVRIVALDPAPARRFEISDPRRDPPSPYWPR
jgi:PIN like domain